MPAVSPTADTLKPVAFEFLGFLNVKRRQSPATAGLRQAASVVRMAASNHHDRLHLVQQFRQRLLPVLRGLADGVHPLNLGLVSSAAERAVHASESRSDSAIMVATTKARSVPCTS